MMDRKRLLWIAVVITVALCACAQKNEPESNFNAEPLDGGKSVAITGYTGSSWTVRIPSKVRNLPITHIGREAFGSKNLTSVTIPNSVITIDVYAFSENQLTSITIGSNVSMWGSLTFDNGFDTFYNTQGRMAGTYIRSGDSWSRQ